MTAAFFFGVQSGFVSGCGFLSLFATLFDWLSVLFEFFIGVVIISLFALLALLDGSFGLLICWPFILRSGLSVLFFDLRFLLDPWFGLLDCRTFVLRAAVSILIFDLRFFFGPSFGLFCWGLVLCYAFRIRIILDMTTLLGVSLARACTSFSCSFLLRGL